VQVFAKGPDCAFVTKKVLRFFVASGVLLLSSCSPTSSTKNEVVVYVSVDDVYSRPIAELFAKRTGIQVKLVPDSEETKSTGLINRLIAEAPRPRADVFWSGDPVRASVLKRRGLAEPYRSPTARDLPPAFSDKEGYFTGFAARIRVLVYNRNLVKQDALPQSVNDLLQPRFSSKACIANPLFGTTSMQAAALFQLLGEAKGIDFFKQLSKNGVAMLSSNGEVRRRVAAGDFQIGLTDSDDVSVGIKDGQPVGFTIPDQDGQGTVIIPCAVVLIKGGPNPENARRFIDFVISDEVERLLAESDAAHIPLRGSVPPPALFKQGVAGIRAMTLDYDRLGQELETLNSGFLLEWATRPN
jgi:iron(III) transport system substrate-binding protein